MWNIFEVIITMWENIFEYVLSKRTIWSVWSRICPFLSPKDFEPNIKYHFFSEKKTCFFSVSFRNACNVSQNNFFGQLEKLGLSGSGANHLWSMCDILWYRDINIQVSRRPLHLRHEHTSVQHSTMYLSLDRRPQPTNKRFTFR